MRYPVSFFIYEDFDKTFISGEAEEGKKRLPRIDTDRRQEERMMIRISCINISLLQSPRSLFAVNFCSY